MSLKLCNLAGLAAGTTLALAAAGAALADPVEEQVLEGLKLYKAGELGAAVTELEFAISDIRKAMSGKLSDTFPPAPAGWTAAEAESSAEAGAAAAMFGGMMGTMLERTYNQTNGDGTMTAQLMIDNPMVQGMAALINNPMLMGAQPGVERLRIGRETGMLKWEPDSGTAEATLLLDGRILMQVSGENLESADTAADLLTAWDIDAVRERTAR
ncbi:hypothetical protein [Thiohalocapsa sp. ML1]|jgi:hypothetical protein|uniref:hypothetical protein n=1 Tax=Thiohalocapsa sp. ML1 TaxID=1431688 RepID=UPI000731F8CF|nr:hypothetical protein [Thiohalocapsa sp. ML1]